MVQVPVDVERAAEKSVAVHVRTELAAHGLLHMVEALRQTKAETNLICELAFHRRSDAESLMHPAEAVIREPAGS